ncbi:putative disease resistance rpp8-like protein 4 [Quercus suber]|uniref:Disease resistance rpp8-like protein 4 n=1 Tax=Quercus suber TaxID=58331 RepID=A0AAW0JBP8_QUESU
MEQETKHTRRCADKDCSVLSWLSPQHMGDLPLDLLNIAGITGEEEEKAHSMAESVVFNAVGRLGNLLIEEATYLKGVSQQVKQTQIELERMQCFLKDADKRQNEDESVRIWVSQIREAAYEVEDVIETFALEIALKNRDSTFKKHVPIFNTRKLYQVGSKIEGIKTRISDLTRSLQTYGVTPIKEVGSNERDQILKMRDEELAKKLNQVQQEKRCLVILDDIWSKEAWDLLSPGFPLGLESSSKILLTTRNREVALHVDPSGFLHEPGCLNEEQSWELFQKKAFHRNDPEFKIFEDMEKLGREMVARCAGLPLAIIVLGGLLATKETLNEWDIVHRNIKLHLADSSTESIRRLAIFSDELLANDYYKKNPQIRSLIYFNENSQQVKSIFKYSKLLRVLDLEGIRSLDGQLPEQIGSLIHLRFLSLKKTCIQELPSSIVNLVCLETLNLETIEELSWESTVLIPTVIWKMKKLRHLYFPKWCNYLTNDKFQLANLSNLQTLVNFPTNKCDVRDLLTLTNLRKLVLNGPRDFQEFREIFNPPIKKLNSLRSLSMKTEMLSFPDKVVVVGQVVQGCPRLHKLHIEGRINKLPNHQEFSPYLAKLTLWGSRLVEDPMPILEKLPYLRVLRGWEAFIGKQMVCSEKGFPQLKSLLLRGLPNLQEWTVEAGAMPSLCRLEITDCNRLVTVPHGLKFVGTLKELEIRWMPRAFKHRLEEEGDDFYKVEHVPSIIFLN